MYLSLGNASAHRVRPPRALPATESACGQSGGPLPSPHAPLYLEEDHLRAHTPCTACTAFPQLIFQHPLMTIMFHRLLRLDAQPLMPDAISVFLHLYRTLEKATAEEEDPLFGQLDVAGWISFVQMRTTIVNGSPQIAPARLFATLTTPGVGSMVGPQGTRDGPQGTRG